MKLLAVLLVCLLIASSAGAVTTYTDGVSALTVSLTGDNAHALIDLLTGIQHLLWMILGAIVALAIPSWVQVFRWHPSSGG